MMKKLRFIAMLAATLFAGAGLTSCSDDDDKDNYTEKNPSEQFGVRYELVGSWKNDADRVQMWLTSDGEGRLLRTNSNGDNVAEYTLHWSATATKVYIHDTPVPDAPAKYWRIAGGKLQICTNDSFSGNVEEYVKVQ